MINQVTSNEIDEEAMCPEFKVAAVKIVKVKTSKFQQSEKPAAIIQGA